MAKTSTTSTKEPIPLNGTILEGKLYLGHLEITLRTLESGMTSRLPVITCRAGRYE